MLKQHRVPTTKEEFDLSIKQLDEARRRLKLFYQRQEARNKLEADRDLDANSAYGKNETQTINSGDKLSG